MAWVFNIVSPVRGYHKFTVPEIKVLRGGVSDQATQSRCIWGQAKYSINIMPWSLTQRRALVWTSVVSLTPGMPTSFLTSSWSPNHFAHPKPMESRVGP